MDDDSQANELAMLRRQFTGLSMAVGVDPSQLELEMLRRQVKILASAATDAVQPPKPREENWVAFPSGQCVPGWFAMSTPAQRAQAGFRWDGDTPVFPESWPKIEPSKRAPKRPGEGGSLDAA